MRLGIAVLLVALLFLPSCAFLLGGLGSPCDLEDKGFIESSRIINEDNPRFRLQTPWTADKNCHAEIYLTYRWADDERAGVYTAEEPPVMYTFGAADGYFPTAKVTPAYEDENDLWNWVDSVNEGAKNSPHPNPIYYWVEVVYQAGHATGGEGDVRVHAEIRYYIYDEDAY